MQRRHFITLSLLPLGLAMAQAAMAGTASYPEYRVTIVGPANSSATDINSAGTVVGNYPYGPGATRGFLNRGAGFVSLGALVGSASTADAINDKGVVLGNWTTAAGQSRGYVYYHGRQRDIGIIPGRISTFTDINNAGYISAFGTVVDSFEGPHGFLRAPGGGYRDLGHLPVDTPFSITTALALNNRNQVTGESGPLTFPDQPLRAYIWTRGVIHDLGDLGFTPNGGQAINDRGQVTGYASVPEGFRNRVAFLYTHGRLIDIDRRPSTAERFSQGTGINNLGHVVGTSDHLSGFIYRGRKMESLNALIDPRLGWNITSPQAINDKGQIAATAFRKGVQYAVRLDLIRPSLEAAPADSIDDEAGPIAQSGLSAEQEAAEAKVEAEAQAREKVNPAGQ